jgi:hypothetical protein
MRPFKVDWDDPQSVGRSRWDWYSFSEDGPFNDPEASALLGGVGLIDSVCRISCLPTDYSLSAVITPDGIWHDLEDFGWSLVEGDSLRNQNALANWQACLRETVALHQNAVGVKVHCHG